MNIEEEQDKHVMQSGQSYRELIYYVYNIGYLFRINKEEEQDKHFMQSGQRPLSLTGNLYIMYKNHIFY